MFQSKMLVGRKILISRNILEFPHLSNFEGNLFYCSNLQSKMLVVSWTENPFDPKF
jgi:hypothetical protein